MELVLAQRDSLDKFVMKLLEFVLAIVLVMEFVMKEFVFAYLVFGKVMHVMLKFTTALKA